MKKNFKSFADVYKDPTNNEQIGLYIYPCFLSLQKSHKTEHLEQAIQRAEGWATVTATNHPDHSRRYKILDMATAIGKEPLKMKV